MGSLQRQTPTVDKQSINRTHYKKVTVTNPITDLLAASRFAGDSILGPAYHFPDELALAIDLTETGESLASELQGKFPKMTEGDISAVLLARFAANDDLLIRTESTSVERVFAILSKEIAERRINYPLVFGRALHDQFIANFGATPIEELTPEQTQRLASLAPQGVFQVEEWVSGPFGLIKSSESRYLPPQNCGPVIRCAQVGCNALHHILMRSSETDSRSGFLYMAAKHLISVDLTRKITDILIPDDDYYRVNHPGGLPWLIGNGFTDDELTRLAEDALTNNTGGLRQRVNILLGGSTAKRAPAVIVKTLSHAALIQLLLLLDDVCLVESIESAIDQRLINLSPTEVRRSFENRHLNGGMFKVDAEASKLGVRFIPKKNLTEPRMLALIRAVFSGHETALSWQLRNEPGADSSYKLEKCLEEQDPRGLLTKVLFSTQEALERTFAAIKYGRFNLPNTSDEEHALVEKIMWKLGSPLPTPKPSHAAIEQLTAQVLTTIATDYPDDESRITAIRNVGMSMFVELEDLLRASSNFACRALLNDHYEMHSFDRFRYYESRARSFSSKVFGDEAAERGAAFPYDLTSGNALSVLISSFRVLAEVCESRLANSVDYRRSDWQVPAFSNHARRAAPTGSATASSRRTRIRACGRGTAGARRTAATTWATPGGGCWSRASGPARPSPTTAPTAKPGCWPPSAFRQPTPPNTYGHPSPPATPTTCHPRNGSCTSSPTASPGNRHSTRPGTAPRATDPRIFRQPGGPHDQPSGEPVRRSPADGRGFGRTHEYIERYSKPGLPEVSPQVRRSKRGSFK
jgi:hypothetical protein